MSSLLPILSSSDVKRDVYRQAHIAADKASIASREIGVQDLHRCLNASVSDCAREIEWLSPWQSRLAKLIYKKPALTSRRKPFKYLGELPGYFLNKMNEASLSLLKPLLMTEDQARLYIAFGKTLYIFRKEQDDVLSFEKTIKFLTLDQSNVVTDLRWDKKGRLIVFIKNYNQAAAIPQKRIQEAKVGDVDHEQLLNASDAVVVNFRTVGAGSIINLSEKYNFNSGKYKVRLGEYAGLEHLPDRIRPYYDQGAEPVCGLAAWLNVAEQLCPEKIPAYEDLLDLFQDRFQERLSHRDLLFFNQTESEKVSRMLGFDLKSVNISNVPLVTRKLWARWDFYDHYSKFLAGNAQRIKDAIDAGKLFYVSVTSSKFYMDTSFGDRHAVVIRGYQFNQKGEMKLLVIDSNNGYAWVDLEHLCSSINENDSWLVSKKSEKVITPKSWALVN